jgi:hypothetical protein
MPGLNCEFRFILLIFRGMPGSLMNTSHRWQRTTEGEMSSKCVQTGEPKTSSRTFSRFC